MDIKWKNIKYSMGAKITAFIIAWLCTMSAFGSGLFLLYNHSIINSPSYYDTYQFENEFNSLVRNVVELNAGLKSIENIRDSSDEEIVKQNLNHLHYIEERLSNTVNFAYSIKNTQTGETITNVSAGDAVSLIKKQTTAIYYNQWTFETAYHLSDNIRQLMSGASFEVHAALIEPLKPGDVFYDDYSAFIKIKSLSSGVTILLVASLILMILAFIYLAIVTGRREKGEAAEPLFIDKIYTDVHTLLVFIAAVISVAFASGVGFPNRVEMIIISLVFGLDVLIGLSYVLSMIRQIKNGQIIKNSLVYKIFDLGFNGKTFKAWTLLLLLGYGMVNGILFALATDPGAGFFVFFFLIILFNVAAIYFSARSLLSLTQIMEAAKEISTGNLDYVLDKSQISVAFSGFTGDIQSIQGGLKKAVAEAVKGERMKTDLIANVSHDLKTPLTSVINYVDLLKKEDLNNDKANEYLNILDEKSARLKQLIEDLIEASKASSGNLTVQKVNINLHELVQQAYGEYEEKIKKAELEVYINAFDKKTLISADGKYMWRIVENLLSNVMKYSLPHSRVYINIARSDQYGLLIIKNISATPLDIPPERLTERFVRGDESRTTEGTGLGLSIAQSLTSLQGGKFKVEIDGDLFKVIIEIPLALE